MQTECAICKMWQDKVNKKVWTTPTPEQRRNLFFQDKHRMSHGYCPMCFLLDLKQNGMTDEEIQELVKELKD